MRLRRCGRAAAGLLCSLALASSASGATFTVTSTADSGAGSLREAIGFANASPDATNSIDFALADGSTIALASALPAVSQELLIDASALANLSVDGSAVAGAFLLANAPTSALDVHFVDGTIQVADGVEFAFSQLVPGSYNGVISSSGIVTLEKRGPDTLVLTGTNSYGGSTDVFAGTLQGDTDSLKGAMNIRDMAILRFDQAADATFSQAITGAGALEKSGVGTLTLDGPLSYSGGTFVLEGAVQGDSADLKGAFDLSSGTLLIFDQSGGAQPFAGNITGAGGLRKEGSGELQLDGNNDFTGGIDIDGGLVRGSTASINTDVSLTPGTSVDFRQTTDGVYAASVSGAGDLVKRGAGVLTLTGANTHSGGTNIMVGTLQASVANLPNLSTSTIQNDGTLRFDQPGGATYQGVISGGGAVEKVGGGTLVYAQPQQYSGGTTLSQGGLQLGGNVPGALTAAAGTTLSGVGQIGGDLATSGRVEPGAGGFGTLGVGGAASFDAGSQLHAQVSETPGAYDSVAVVGSVAFDNSSVSVDFGADAYLAPVQIPLVTSGAAPGGSLPTLLTDAALLTESLSFQGNDLVLDVVSNGLSLDAFAQTPNQLQVALALEADRGDPDIDTVIAALSGLTGAQLPAAYDSMSGEHFSHIPALQLAKDARFDESMRGRTRSFRGEGARPLVGSTEHALRLGWGSRQVGRAPLFAAVLQAAPRVPGARERRRSRPFTGLEREHERAGVAGWVDAWGVFGDLDSDGNAAAFDYDVWGGAVGVDAALGDTWLIGASAGYAYTGSDLDGRSDELSGNSALVGLYGAWASGPARIDANARYGYSSFDSERTIPLSGLTRVATSDVKAHDFGLSLEAGLDVAEWAGVTLEPVASLAYAHLAQNAISESGAGSINLQVDSQGLDSILTGLGVRLRGDFEVDRETRFAPEVRALWIYEAGDTERVIDARFQSGATLAIAGVEIPRNGGLVGVGWTVAAGPSLDFRLGYDLRIDSVQLAHAVAVGLTGRW